MGPAMILRAPTDIFPSINIPVVAVAWTCTGLSPEETEGRITTLYERALTTLVENIEHLEFTTVNGTSIVKIYLQPSVSIGRANAQVTAVSQTILRQPPPGSLPPLIVKVGFLPSNLQIRTSGVVTPSGSDADRQNCRSLGCPDLLSRSVTSQFSCGFPYRKPAHADLSSALQEIRVRSG